MKYNAETGPTDGERTSGYEFMKHRIRKILLVCCSYDGYILEEDGHIEQQINQEYIDLNMSNPPALLRVSSKAPKKETANTTSNKKNRILKIAFVDKSFNALAPKMPVINKPITK